jgi:hypothetical protein
MSDFKNLVAAELAEPVDPRVTAMATAIAQHYGVASRAVLFYGSCLRERELDGLMLDFYVIVSDYDAAYSKRWLARANRMIPPNVFPFAHENLAAKYAVLSEDDFLALNQATASTVSVWARFAQPTRLVWVSDDVAKARAIDAVANAAQTLLSLAAPIAGAGDLALWKAGFAETYKAEIRAERTNRSGSIVDADPDRYRLFEAALTLPAPLLSRANAMKKWRKLQRHGKMMSLIRLAKASFTFAGGIDYLAWKINRHAGTKIEIKPWQRKWPLVAAVFLVPRLLLKGAVR